MSFFEVSFQERQKGSLRREKTVVPEAGTKARQGESTSHRDFQYIRTANLTIMIALVAFALAVLSKNSDPSELLNLLSFYASGAVMLTTLIAIVYLILAQVISLLQTKTLTKDVVGRYFRMHWQKTRLWGLAAPLIAMPLLMASFGVFKSKVLGSYPFLYDATFISWDRALFAGTDPWRLTHAIFATPESTAFLDKLYHVWYYPMVLAYFTSIVVVQKPQVRLTYMVSYLLSWVVIGMFLALLMLSAGPSFDGVLFGTGEYFQDLQIRLSEQSDAIGGLTALNYQNLLAQYYEEDITRVGSGVSAMPSMHVALVALWVIAAWKVSRIIGFIVFLYGILIWIGSVHLGWHYAVDGVVSAVAVSILWVISEKFLRI